MPIRAAKLRCSRRADGCFVLESDYALPAAPRSIVHAFAERARETPERAFIARRRALAGGGRGDWQRLSYGEAEGQLRSVAQGLIDRGCGPEASVMVLSGPSIEHAILMLGAYAARAPYAPISPNHSLMSGDFTRLRQAFETCRPKLVFVDDAESYRAALEALPLGDAQLVSVTPARTRATTAFAELLATPATRDVDGSLEAIASDTHARTLFTSGSTGAPKGAVHSHGMLAAYMAQQQAMFVEDVPYGSGDLLSWLPWSHVGGSNNFCVVIHGAGTLYLDEGRPVAGEAEESLRNLREIPVRDLPSPPALFGPLVNALEADAAFRDAFFRELRLILYGGASLAQDLLERLQALAVAAGGQRIPITTKYGTTEAMGISQVPWPVQRAGEIGVPNAGVTIKLAPCADRLELRVKGPCVTSGYLRDPRATAEAFDEEGFFRTGDAARLADPRDPAKGLVFDGRVVENFKLGSGSWVSVGPLRAALIEALELLHDCVVAGHDRDDVRVLAWLRQAEAAECAGLAADTPAGELIRSPAVLGHLSERLDAYNARAGGGTRRVRRVLLLREPPSPLEVADKGSINQAACLRGRAALVDALYAADEPSVIAEP